MRFSTLSLAFLFFAAGIILVSCKKNSGEVLSTNDYTDAVIPDNAAGALYAVRTVTYRRNDMGSYDTTYTSQARAWFGSRTNTKTTSLVRINVDTLAPGTITVNNKSYNWYQTNPLNHLNFFVGGGNTIYWRVFEDSVNQIPNMDIMDNGQFGNLLLTSIPDSVTMGQPIKAVFKYLNPGSTATDQLMFMAKGSLGNVGWPISLTSTTESISTRELARITVPGDSVIVTIMPAKIRTEDVGFGKYYFVKESAVSKVVKIY